MAARPLPSGVGVALVTIFGDDGRPDVAATAARARRCAELGVSSVLVAGTTGEAPRLSIDDRLAIGAAVKDAVPETVVLVGTGQPDAEAAVAASAKVAAEGAADSLLVYVPRDADPERFFARIRAEVSPLPVVAYHNPAIDALELPAQLLAELPIEAVKDSSASTNRLADLVELGVRVYVGSATQVALAGACGAAGALLAVANVVPSMCIAAWHGDMAAQRALFRVHREAAAGFPSYLKATEPR